MCIRPTFSSPPKHGACIVAKTVLNPELFAAWRVELKVWPKPHICATGPHLRRDRPTSVPGLSPKSRAKLVHASDNMLSDS